MSFWKIAWRNIEQRGLASALTALSMALGVAVMIVVIVVYAVTVRQFQQNAQGYNLIVGGKGGSLQLVLSTVYHIGQPLYPIPYTYYQKFLPGGEFADSVAVAIPQCLGDSYEAPNGTHFRVIGTSPDLFDKIEYGRESDGTSLRYQFQEGGRNLREAGQLHGRAFHDAAYEAVVGSIVAAQAGLKLGDDIQPTHGIGGDGHKHDGFEVVGILKPTGTANDRAVFINIEGFYRLEGHALAEDTEHAEESKEHPAAHTAPDTVKQAAAHDHHDEAGHKDEHAHKEGEHAEEHAHEHKDAEHADEAKAHAAEHAHDEKEHAAEKAGSEKEHAAEHAVEKHQEAGHDHAEHPHEHPHPAGAHDEKAHGEHKHAEHAHEEHGHDEHGHHHGHIDEPLPIDQREVTSILVLCRDNPLYAMGLDMGINKGKDRIAQAVAPAREVAMLLNSIVGPMRIVLLVLTVLVVIVAGISILVSIYNSMNERSHDIAVMRALGASRNAVMGIILVESILLSLGGGLLGMLLGHGIIGVASPYVLERTGIALGLFEFDWQELVLIPGLVVLASLVGFLPALAAYRTDVAKSLAGSR
jgi:putative ABC transport system permease protein